MNLESRIWNRTNAFLAICAVIGTAALVMLWPDARTSGSRGAPDGAPVEPTAAPAPVAPDIEPDDPIRGNPNAPLTIIEFADFTCPACADAEDVLTALRTEYRDRLRIVWKDLPHLDRITGSRTLHLAGACARTQGKFWEFHDAIFGNALHEVTALADVAATVGLDLETLAACMERGIGSANINADMAAAARAGVTATPAFFVNGTLLTGAPTPDAFRALLDRAP